MRVLVVGAGAEDASLGESLEAAGLAVDRWPEETAAGDGPQEIAQIARELREFEGALGDSGAGAVLVASESPASLAAVLVATKLGIPVACRQAADGAGDDGANGRLIRQLADTALAADPVAIVEWVRAGYPARA